MQIKKEVTDKKSVLKRLNGKIRNYNKIKIKH